jgi:arsenate reductase (thioredoxin)
MKTPIGGIDESTYQQITDELAYKFDPVFLPGDDRRRVQGSAGAELGTAAAIADHLGAGRIHVRTAGSQPVDQINPTWSLRSPSAASTSSRRTKQLPIPPASPSTSSPTSVTTSRPGSPVARPARHQCRIPSPCAARRTRSMTNHPTVLFVCVHNAGRSQMAAGYLHHLAGDRVTVLSAGSAPADQINPVAVQAMAEEGIDITAAQPKVLTTHAVQTSDVVVTMGCGDTCPYYTGKRYEDWKLEDPAGQGIDSVRPIRDEIRRRIQALIDDIAPA